jgi:hypothetical protein
MRGNPFLRFHQAAEAAGYPALLIVSALCLGLVVAPVALLGLTQAGWVFALALLGLVAAVAILGGAIDAAVSDYDAPAAERKRGRRSPSQREPVVRLPRRQVARRQAGEDRHAA